MPSLGSTILSAALKFLTLVDRGNECRGQRTQAPINAYAAKDVSGLQNLNCIYVGIVKRMRTKTHSWLQNLNSEYCTSYVGTGHINVVAIGRGKKYKICINSHTIDYM